MCVWVGPRYIWWQRWDTIDKTTIAETYTSRMAEMDRNLQVETLLQEIEMLRFENEELKKQRNMDRLQMQSDWQRHMEGSSLQPTPQLENTVQFPVQVKKEYIMKVHLVGHHQLR